MKDILPNTTTKINYYDFITNFSLQKKYYDFYTNNLKVKNIKSIKRRISCFVKTQPRFIQVAFKNKKAPWFLPGNDFYRLMSTDRNLCNYEL